MDPAVMIPEEVWGLVIDVLSLGGAARLRRVSRRMRAAVDGCPAGRLLRKARRAAPKPAAPLARLPSGSPITVALAGLPDSECRLLFHRWDLDACQMLARGGHGLLLCWVRSSLDGPLNPWGESLSDEAARRGYLDLMRWMRAQDPPCALSRHTLNWAARFGRLETVRWLCAQGGSVGSHTCHWAAMGGHLSVLQWLRARDPPCSWDDRVSVAAAGGGHVKLMRWLWCEGKCPWSPHVWFWAGLSGHVDVLRWMRADVPRSHADDVQARAGATEGGHVHLLNWLEEPCVK